MVPGTIYLKGGMLGQNSILYCERKGTQYLCNVQRTCRNHLINFVCATFLDLEVDTVLD